jgi:hypothetical protein
LLSDHFTQTGEGPRAKKGETYGHQDANWSKDQPPAGRGAASHTQEKDEKGGNDPG